MIETFLDVLLIEEIPVEDATGTGIVTASGQEIVRTQSQGRKPMWGKVLSCDKQFPRHGMMVDMPYKVGDVVKTNEFGRDYQTFSVADELPGATKYYLIRYDDIQGRKARTGFHQCRAKVASRQCMFEEGHEGNHTAVSGIR